MPNPVEKQAIDLFVDSVFYEPALGPGETPVGVISAVRDGYSMPSELHTTKAWSVWRCIEPGSGREVVIKTASLHSPLTGDEIAERLRVEFDLLGKLSTHRVVKGRAETIAGASSYLAIEYAGDDDIAFHALMKYCNDPSGFSALLMQAVQAVADLHKNDVVHGDLKPQHFVMNEDTPVLIDFGLSASLQSPIRQLNTQPWLAGTPGYIAPEVEAGQATHHDTRQDVYSLGVTLKNLAESWSTHSGMRVPKPITRVIRNSTQPDPAERYPDAQALMADLTRAMRPRRASRIAACAASLGVLATLGVGTLIATAPSPGPRATGPESKEPAFLDLDWTAGHVAVGDGRARFLADVNTLPEKDQAAWEVGLVRHGGLSHPFGESPFGETPAISWRYHHASQSLAWYSAKGYFAHRSIADSQATSSPGPAIAGIEFSENGKQIVLIDNQLDVHTAELYPDRPFELLGTPIENARAAFTTLDGHILAIERVSNVLHTWDQVEQHTREHGYASVLLVRSNPRVLAFYGRDTKDRRIVAVESLAGETLLAATPTADAEGVLVCADYSGDPQTLCLGYDDGTVALYDVGTDQWRTFHCPAQSDATAVLLVPEEDRLFVASHGVHVYRLSDGQHTLTLGGTLVVNEYVTQLIWEPATRAVYIESNLGVKRWHAAESE